MERLDVRVSLCLPASGGPSALLVLHFPHLNPPAGESGSADTVRDPRGFAVKFYTEDGNWDLVGNNTPIFFIRDAILVGDSVFCTLQTLDGLNP